MAVPWPNDEFSQAQTATPGDVEQGRAMSHTGSSPQSADKGQDGCTGRAGRERGLVDSTCPANPAGETMLSLESGLAPIQAARADAAKARDSLPFVLLSGQTLYMVAEESTGWVLAELRFDAGSCTFVEARRSEFQWPREALGRLMSMTMVEGAMEDAAAERVANAFAGWVASQFVA
jgi:hypothetical protein